MGSSSARQREIVENYKYPDPEGVRRANYYQPARDKIGLFYRKECDVGVVLSAIDSLDRAHGDTQYARTRIKANTEVLQCFLRDFAQRTMTNIQGRPITKRYTHSGVDVNVTVDLRAKERGVLHYIKFQLARTNDPVEHGKIVCQLIFQVLRRANPAPSASAMRVWNCQDGNVYKLANVRSRTAKEIEAACKNIALIWDSV